MLHKFKYQDEEMLNDKNEIVKIEYSEEQSPHAMWFELPKKEGVHYVLYIYEQTKRWLDVIGYGFILSHLIQETGETPIEFKQKPLLKKWQDYYYHVEAFAGDAVPLPRNNTNLS